MSSGVFVKPIVRPVNPRKQRLWLGLILILYLLVTLAYGVVNPLFEAPDEQFHYYTIELIRKTRQLPFVPASETDDELISQEAAQPPLYYLLSAALIAPIDTSQARKGIWPNKYPAMGDAGELNNRNIFIHTAAEAWPWQGYALAVHLLRGISTLLGLGTLLFIYGSGRLLWRNDPYRALLAAGLIAFLPQYNFLFASLSNDPLIIFFTSAAIWQLIRLWQNGETRGRLLLLGITIGLAMMSKNAGVILLLYAAGFVFLLALRDWPQPGSPKEKSGGWPLIGELIFLVILPALLLGGWILVRNYLLYDDFTATNQFLRFSSGDREFTIIQVLKESGGLWLSLIAVFGWFNVRPPDWVYWFWNATILTAITGGVWHWLRSYKNPTEDKGAGQLAVSEGNKISRFLRQGWILPLLLAGWAVLIYGSLLIFMLRTEAAQGRLLFPALIPLALGLAYGWTVLDSLRRLSIVLLPLAFLITMYCLFFVIRPVYAIPQTVAMLPADVQERNFDLGRGLTLVGAKVDTQQAMAGDAVWMTLYWKADPVPKDAVEHIVSVFGQDLVEIGKLHSYHGRGLYPATEWPEGEIIAEHFAVQLNEAIKTPVLARIESGLAGEGISFPIGEVKIIPEKWPDPEQHELARLGEMISLTSVVINPVHVEAGNTIDIDVQWKVLSATGRDFTTLIHLGQPDQPPLAVGDRPPLNGFYPTRVWEAGEIINDAYTLSLPPDLPPGKIPIWIGLYDTQTIERLPVTVNGELQENNVILAGWVEIE